MWRARGLPMAQVAMAWLLHKPAISSAIVGVTKAAQLDDALAALAIPLDADEIAALEKPYFPHRPVGF